MIATIGYQGLDPETLRAIVDRLGAVLIDCRSSPRSRVPGFGGRQLAALLGRRYMHRPDLGGRTRIAPKAVASLRPYYVSRRRHALLLCMEASPADCHRHHAITAKAYPRAAHVIDRGRFVVSSAAVSRFVRTGYLPRREVRPLGEVAP